MLYRKYRPKRFLDVVGQDIVGRILKRAIGTGRVSHAYLFSGPRGVGKTTLARLIAKAVNCLNRDRLDRQSLGEKFVQEAETLGEPCNECEICHAIDNESLPDVLEIDAASNRGIDEIRDLRNKVKFPPMRCRYKVYIIDEAHMLTREAFNALLKTLEEPPSHAIFILCTTEPQKVPDTIISRCQWYELRLGTQDDIVFKLSRIVENEGLKVEDGVLRLVAALGRGSFRDAESLFSMVIEGLGKDEEITLDKVRSILKLPSDVLIRKTVDLIEKGDVRTSLKKISLMQKRGFNGERVIDGIIDVVQKRMIDALGDLTLLKLRMRILKAFIEAKKMMHLLPDPYSGIELAVVELGQCSSVGDDVKPEQIEGKARSKKDTRENRKSLKESMGWELKQILERWDEVVKEAEIYNDHLSSMLEAAEVKEVDGNVIVLSVVNEFSKRALESGKTAEIMDKVTEKIFGKSYKIRCVTIDGNKTLRDLSEKELLSLLNGEVKK